MPATKFSIQGVTINGEWDEANRMLFISELGGELGLEGKLLGFTANIRGALDITMDNYVRIKVHSIGKVPKFIIPAILNLVKTFNRGFAKAVSVNGDVIRIDPNRIGAAGAGSANNIRVLLQPKNLEIAASAAGSFRERFLVWAQKNAAPAFSEAADLLAAIPDSLMLLINLAKDPRIANALKLQIALGVAYVITPFDLIPELIAGPLGFVDDALAMGLLITKLVTEIPPEIIRENWQGRPETLEFILKGHALGSAMVSLTRKLPEGVAKKLVSLFGTVKDEAAATEIKE